MARATVVRMRPLRTSLGLLFLLSGMCVAVVEAMWPSIGLVRAAGWPAQVLLGVVASVGGVVVGGALVTLLATGFAFVSVVDGSELHMPPTPGHPTFWVPWLRARSRVRIDLQTAVFSTREDPERSGLRVFEFTSGEHVMTSRLGANAAVPDFEQRWDRLVRGSARD